VYPVLAMRGAPASYPVQSKHRHLQRHLVFSRRIEDEAQKYIDGHFAQKKFIGIHLRNGADWVSECLMQLGYMCCREILMLRFLDPADEGWLLY